MGCLCAGHARGNSPRLPCDTNEHGAITDPKDILANNAGAVLSRRCRATNTTVTLYDAADPAGDMDSEDGRWWTVCENHGYLVAHLTRAAAEAHLSHPDEWCEVCLGNEPQ
jgi:hypothetical protein